MSLLFQPSIFGTIDFRLPDGHCLANAGVGADWLTVYLLKTDDGYEGKGEASRIMAELKRYCDKTGKTMRVWCPMDKRVDHICKKLGIETTTLDDEMHRKKQEVNACETKENIESMS